MSALDQFKDCLATKYGVAADITDKKAIKDLLCTRNTGMNIKSTSGIDIVVDIVASCLALDGSNDAKFSLASLVCSFHISGYHGINREQDNIVDLATATVQNECSKLQKLPGFARPIDDDFVKTTLAKLTQDMTVLRASTEEQMKPEDDEDEDGGTEDDHQEDIVLTTAPKTPKTQLLNTNNHVLMGVGRVVLVDMKDGQEDIKRIPFLMPKNLKQRPKHTIMFKKKYQQLMYSDDIPDTRKSMSQLSKSMQKQFTILAATKKAMSIEPAFGIELTAPVYIIDEDIDIKCSLDIDVFGVIGQNIYDTINAALRRNEDGAGYNPDQVNQWIELDNLNSQTLVDGKPVWKTDEIEDVLRGKKSHRKRTRPLVPFVVKAISKLSKTSTPKRPETKRHETKSDDDDDDYGGDGMNDLLEMNQEAERLKKIEYTKLAKKADREIRKQLEEKYGKTGGLPSAPGPNLKRGRPQTIDDNRASSVDSSRSSRSNSHDRRRSADESSTSDDYDSETESVGSEDSKAKDLSKCSKIRTRKLERIDESIHTPFIDNSRDRGRRSWSPSHKSKSNRKIPILEKFTGKGSFAGFKYQFERIAREEKWLTTENKKARKSKLRSRLFDYLKDDALEFALNIGKKALYTDIMDKLEKIYGRRAQRNLAKIHLSALEQKADQSLLEFFQTVLKKAQEAYPGDLVDRSSTQDHLVSIFLQGLYDKRPSLTIMNTHSPPKTLYDAFVAVSNIQENREALLQSERKKKSIKRAILEQYTDSDDSDESEAEQLLEEFKARYATARRGDRPKPSGFDRKVAYLAREAAKLLPSKKSPERASKDQCYFCLATDHIVRDCPVRLEEEELRLKKMMELYKKQAEENKNKPKLPPKSSTDSTKPLRSALKPSVAKTREVNIVTPEEDEEDSLDYEL